MDIQATEPKIKTSIPKVGVRNVRVPIQYKRKGDDNPIKLETKVSMYVNLTDELKGINMSRLSRTLYEYVDKDKHVSTEFMYDVLKSLQDNLGAKDAYLKFRFNYPIRKKSLVSDNSGWMYYPTVFEVESINGKLQYTMTVSITYSSTCPCSADLSKMLTEKRVIRDGKEVSIDSLDNDIYKEEHMNGTAHAQRSIADVKIRFSKDDSVWIEDLVEAVEKRIKTPVQVIVKREDEQHFAYLNYNNQMFVEDAVRNIGDTVDQISGVLDWSVVVNHYESLHPSDAVAVIWKGIPNGLR